MAKIIIPADANTRTDEFMRDFFHMPQIKEARDRWVKAGFNLAKKRIVKLLRSEGYTIVMEHYDTMVQSVGKLFVGEGSATQKGTKDDEDDYWGRTTITLEVEGVPVKLISDDDLHWGEERVTRTMAKLSSSRRAREEDESKALDTVRLPVHPYVRCFSLHHHCFCEVHAGKLQTYLFRRNIFDKVIIPDEHKQLILALTDDEKRIGDDVIAGKGKGIIMLCSGPPGTGKTLTGECFSEHARRALYSVQCSQLGIEAQTLERQLGVVLARATRWGCVLLLDEADVYIRERGDDINQNAVVGVLLRLLEYYRGVLFLTTNRATVVDDAIMSRCLAHIKYKLPNKDKSIRIRKQNAAQFELEMSDELIAELAKEFLGISGRTIKHLCRIAETVHRKMDRSLDLDLFQWASEFVSIEPEEGDK